MFRITIIVVISLTFFSHRCISQSINTMDSLENSYQSCLDRGQHMLNCSKVYYQQMDSMLNMVYKDLRKKMTPADASQLKNSQIQWLKQRDKYFGNIVLEPEEKSLGKDDQEMVILDKKSEFVRDRVLELMKKL